MQYILKIRYLFIIIWMINYACCTQQNRGNSDYEKILLHELKYDEFTNIDCDSIQAFSYNLMYKELSQNLKNEIELLLAEENLEAKINLHRRVDGSPEYCLAIRSLLKANLISSEIRSKNETELFYKTYVNYLLAQNSDYNAFLILFKYLGKNLSVDSKIIVIDSLPINNTNRPIFKSFAQSGKIGADEMIFLLHLLAKFKKENAIKSTPYFISIISQNLKQSNESEKMRSLGLIKEFIQSNENPEFNSLQELYDSYMIKKYR